MKNINSNDPEGIGFELSKKKLNMARYTSLILIILTVVNVVLFLVGADLEFPFSVFLPYLLFIIGLLYIKNPADYIAENEVAINTDALKTFGIALIIVAIVMIAIYLILWLFSKKNPGVLIAVTVLFAIDTVALLVFSLSDITSVILNLVLHVWAMYELIAGISAYKRLKKMPGAGINAPFTDISGQNNEQTFVNTSEISGGAEQTLETPEEKSETEQETKE